MSTLAITVIALVIGFFVMTMLGHSIHWMIHQRWAGKLYKAHMTHHEVLYPVTDFLSDTYRQPGKDNTIFTFLVFSIPVFAVPVFLFVYGTLPLVTMALLIVEIFFIGWLHDYLHDVFHLRGHILKRIAYFRHLTDVHYMHHVDMQKNFGIFFFVWDRAFASYQAPSLPSIDKTRKI